jgi:hypothetical protein
MKKNKTQIIIVLSFVLSFFLFDWAFFRYGQFLLPNESPWNTNHFFNFLYEYKRIARAPKFKPRILVLGSSIAYYSISAELLSKELKQKTGKDFEIIYLAYAGNSPLYVYLLLDWLFPLQPDLVIYPINFIDFRLHRTYVLYPDGKNEDVNENSLIRDALTFAEAPQSLWVFPWETLKETSDSMEISVQAKYLLAGIFSFYKDQDFYLTNLQNIYNHRFGRNTSYHAYMGVQIPEGISTLGWTGKKFSFYPIKKMKTGNEGIWVEITPFLLKSGTATLTFTTDSGRKQVETFESAGWKKIFLEPRFFDFKEIITAELSQVWYAHEASGAYLDYHYDPMGVRLQQTFGLDIPPSAEQYKRPIRSEDFRYEKMSDDTYETYFYYRLLQGLEFRPGIGYLVALENAKKRIAKEKFRPVFHLSYLKKISQIFEDRNIPLLILNNPENPVSLAWYENSLWYKEYLVYLHSLESSRVHISDLRRSLPMQGFSDFHHFTYLGMVQMNPIYAKEIVNLFSK